MCTPASVGTSLDTSWPGKGRGEMRFEVIGASGGGEFINTGTHRPSEYLAFSSLGFAEFEGFGGICRHTVDGRNPFRTRVVKR